MRRWMARRRCPAGHECPLARGPFWENPWFFMAQVVGWVDIKIAMRGGPRRTLPVGMGTILMSKTLRPYVYGESVDNCPKTMVLLPAWTSWRSRWGDWFQEEDSREREVDGQLVALEADVRSLCAAPLAMPLLGSAEAHTF